MRTNFLRSTVMLIMVLILPMIASLLEKAQKYSSTMRDWHFIFATVCLAVLFLILLVCLILLVYSFFFSKGKQSKIDL